MNFPPDFPYLAFGLILCFGSFIQATAGFGFGLFAVPSLILLGIPPYIANRGGGTDDAFDGIGDHYLAVDIDPVSRRATVALVVTGPE